jgi:hypothetical protein
MNHAGDTIPDGFPVEIAAAGNGRGAIKRPSKALAIVGSHPDTRENAPYEDERFDVWLFNEAPQKPEVYRRWTASFQLHKPEVYASEKNWVNSEHWEWLQQDHGDKTIWMQDVDERVPNSKKYPLDEVLSLVPYKYLRSTPAMALALGIYLGYREIWLYGSELSSNTEYTYQAINYAFWIGFAHGLNIDLHMECWHNEFFHHPIYGYEGEVQIPIDFFELRVQDAETYLRSIRNGMSKVESKIDDAMLDFKPDKVGELSLALEEIALSIGEAEGALSEAKRYLEITDPISRQQFERVSAQAQIDGEQKRADMYHSGGRCEYVWNVWKNSGNAQALQQFRIFLKDKTNLALETGRLQGVFRENLQYMNKYDELVTAVGGKRAVYQAESEQI